MRRRAFHEAHGRDERVEHAGILSDAAGATQGVEETIGILARQIVRMRDADRSQILRERRADVWNRLEPFNRSIVG